MDLGREVKEKLRATILSNRGNSLNRAYGLNKLLWSLTGDEVAEACQLAEELDHPLDPDLIDAHIRIRQRWPNPEEVLLPSQELAQRFPLASLPLLRGRQRESYILLSYADWASAEPLFILQILEDIRQGAKAAGSEGYARMAYKSEEGEGGCDRTSFVLMSLAFYTQYPPGTCRRVFLPRIHASGGGLFNYNRRGRSTLESAEYTFWGISEQAEEAARQRQSELSHRLYMGGYG